MTKILTQNLTHKSIAVQSHNNHQLLLDDLQSEYYSLIFDHYPDAIFTFDRNGSFLSANHNVEKFIGYKLNELKGRTFNYLIKEEYIDEVLMYFQRALMGEQQNYHCEVFHKDGHTVHLNVTNIPIKVKGNIVGVYGFAKNQTTLNQKEAELLKITKSLNLAQEVAKIGSWDFDVKTNLFYCSDPLYSILGIQKNKDIIPNYEILLGMICLEDQAIVDYHFQQAKKTGCKMDLEYRIQRHDGSIITVHIRAVAKKDHNGKVSRIIGILYDISDRVIIENRLKESEEKFETIANNLDVGIWSLDCLTNQIVYASPATEKLTGYKSEDFLSGKMIWKNLIHPNDLMLYTSLQSKLLDGEILHHQYRIIAANGEFKWIEDKTFPILNSEGHLVRLDGIVQDISERKMNEEKIKYLAYHDYLTELPNRLMFDQMLDQLTSDENEKFALFYLDMDRFKFVNDTLGHEIGDALLREISRRISSIVGKNEIFRVGGDEFAIIQTDIVAKAPIQLAKEIISEIKKPFLIEGYEIHITTSIGISLFPDDGDAVKKLKMNSDAALYRAKELGKNNVQLFTKSLDIERYKMYRLENDLRKAIEREEFTLHYQPKVDTFTKEIIGAEALIRWNHPELGMVSPGEFIPLAEETDFINEISDWVIQQVCKQQHEWAEKGNQLVPISINLTAKTLMKADLVLKIKECLAKYSLSPSLIEIEITEDSLIKNEGSAVSTIRLLKNLGLSIAIDDFGTGYSSIGYLKKFKVDHIKIDRSFLKEINENIEDSTIVQSIILLAKGFCLKVVAEGVETEEQWELLKLLNCHYIQGFLFSKPLPEEQFGNLLPRRLIPLKTGSKYVYLKSNKASVQ